MTARAVFFIGGGSRDKLAPVHERISETMERSDRLLLIPFATEESSYERWYENIAYSFSQFGIRQISMLHIQETTAAMIRQIESAQALYLSGGLPDRLLERLDQKQLIEKIKNFDGTVIGYSAGALALCKDCIITKDDDYPETKVVTGLGLVEFSVEVHYKPSIDEELHSLSEQRVIIAMPNGSAIRWNGSEITPMNDVFRFYRGQKSELRR